MAHQLPPLPYDFSALEPHIDAQTMQIHHGKHHQAYVNNLNAALEKAPGVQDKPLEELLADLNAVPDHLRVSFAVRPDDAPDADPLATGKDLAALQAELAPRLTRRLAAAASSLTRSGATR